MNFNEIRECRCIGNGFEWTTQIKKIGRSTVVEDGVRIFHPENVSLGERVWVGHQGYINGYHMGHVTVGDDTWIGPFAYLHGAAGLTIGRAVGIGPRVTIMTSAHSLENPSIPVIHGELMFSPVCIEDGADVGACAVILTGITVGEGAVVGAGAVVTRDVAPYTVVAGNPAQEIRHRR